MAGNSSNLQARFGELLNSLSPAKREELYSALHKVDPSKREAVILSLVERYEKMKAGKPPISSVPLNTPTNPPMNSPMNSSMNAPRPAPSQARATAPVMQAPQTRPTYTQPSAPITQPKQAQADAFNNTDNTQNISSQDFVAPKKTVKKKRHLGVGMYLLIAIVVVLVAAFALWKTGVIDSILGAKTQETTTAITTTEATTEATTTVPTETTPTASPTPTPIPLATNAPDLTGLTIVIDPGHQATTNYTNEPIASWLSLEKPSCTCGATGVVTGIAEYDITLQTAIMMRDYLVQCGATVILTRESNDVDLSNSARAQIAVDSGADVFIRLHADAANDSATSGIRVYVPDSGDYSSSVVAWGDSLGELVAQSTGAEFIGTSATYNYTGLNYANSIPSFQLCMGYLSNSDDEALLSTDEYRYEVVTAVAEFCLTFVEEAA